MASAGKEVSAVAGNGENPLGTSDDNDVCASGTLHGSGTLRECSVLGSGSPTMPHLDLDSQSLDASYPSLVAPVDDWLEDVVDDSEDGILKAGERIASEIREAMQTRGRRRRVPGDMVGLVGESSAGSTTHTDCGGYGGTGRGGLGGEETESVEQQEENLEKEDEGNPAAKSVRRRSVKMCTHLGRITSTTSTRPCPSTSSSSTRSTSTTAPPRYRFLSSCKVIQHVQGESISESESFACDHVWPLLRPFGPKYCLSVICDKTV
jgi:hypothetical protein